MLVLGAKMISSIWRRRRKFSQCSSPTGTRSPIRIGSIRERHHICEANNIKTCKQRGINIDDDYDSPKFFFSSCFCWGASCYYPLERDFLSVRGENKKLTGKNKKMSQTYLTDLKWQNQKTRPAALKHLAYCLHLSRDNRNQLFSCWECQVRGTSPLKYTLGATAWSQGEVLLPAGHAWIVKVKSIHHVKITGLIKKRCSFNSISCW